jgi:electron transfer flavoprotein alpha subunit
MIKRDLQIWVFGDHRNDPQDRVTLQLLAKARSLAGDEGTVTGILVGHRLEEIAKKYIAYGAQRVLLVDHPTLAFYRADLWTTIVSNLTQEYKPEILLFGSSELGKELAPRCKATRSRALCRLHLLRLGRTDRKADRSSPAFSGNFLAHIVWNTRRPYMATVSPGIFPERPQDENARGEIVKVEKTLITSLPRST